MNKITIDRATVEQALEIINGMEQNCGNLWQVNAEAEELDDLCTELRQALQQPNEFHPDWDQIKPFHDRIAELESVAKQALEALNAALSDDRPYIEKSKQAITALRERLAQPEQTVSMTEYKRLQDLVTSQGIRLMEYESAQTEQGPVIDKSAAIRIATALGWEPKKEWVGLTEKERELLYHTNEPYADLEAVEALLKEKNT